MTLEELKQKWKFIEDALEGKGGFEDGSYLDKFAREDDDKYKERQKIATYTNFFKPKLNRYIGYIYKQKPNRFTNNKLIKLILDNIDNKRNSANVFFSNFATNAKAFGCNLVLVDMPKELPSTLQEQIQTRALPFVREVKPYSIVEYKIDSYGNFDYIVFEDTIFGNKKIIKVNRYYDKTNWIVFDDENNIIDKGEHNLGITPILLFSENDKLSLGEFSQIADLQKKHYNLNSELDEIMRGQTFPILTLQASFVERDLTLSTNNALLYEKDAERPNYIAPPTAPADIYERRIKAIEKQIDDIAFDISTNQSQESGIALTLKFQGLNSSLSKFAQRVEDFELRVFEVIFRYLGMPFDIEITYTKEFSIVDIQKEIGIFEEMKDLINSPTYNVTKAMQIVSNDLGSVGQDKLTAIQQEIEDSYKES